MLCPPVLQFCIRKEEEEEEMTVLAVEDRYTRSFLVALPCLYVLYPNLVLPRLKFAPFM
jgi:hypothetical protein